MTLPIAVAQLRPVKADPDATLDRVQDVLAGLDEADPPPRAVLFPETALTGYFLEGGVAEVAVPAERLFRELRDRYREATGGERPLEVGIGFYERAEGRVHNAALYAELGGPDPEILHVHRKVFLPTYGVFEEDRFVEPGPGFTAFDTSWGQAAMLICEDAWHSLSGTLAALEGARVLFVPSASPAHGVAPGPGRPGSLDRWERLLRATAEEHGVFVVYAGLAGFEGGKGMSGGSMVIDPAGRVLARGPLWEEAVLHARLDPAALEEARSRSPLLADLEAALPRVLSHARLDHLIREGEEATGSGREREEAEPAEPPARTSAPSGEEAIDEGVDVPGGGAPDPEDRSPLAIDPELVEGWLVEFLRQEVRERRGFDRVVLGLSGGVDSALTAALCARALGPGAVHAFLLPSDVTSEESLEDGRLVADELGLETRTIGVGGAVDAYLEEHEPDAGPLRRGNVAARQRMIVLFDQSKKLDALPVGTGNKSERLLGYFTWHADDAGPVNPLGDLFKTQVWEMARHVGLPDRIVEKPPSAELEPGQTDEEDLGLPYREADLILYWLIRSYAPAKLVACGFDRSKVEAVHRRLHATHFKRHLPTVAMLTDTSVGDWYLRPVDYRRP